MTDSPATIDPRDDVLGRSRVTDTPELEAFYDDLARRNAATSGPSARIEAR
jgi:gentisate 1,2-dioxygenase